MKWPWTTHGQQARLVIGSAADQLAWLQADTSGRLQRAGVVPRGAAAEADFARQVRALGLPTQGITAVLSLAEAQLLQIDAPAVKPDEMKAAARWHVKDLVDGHIDDYTLDVLMVGDAQPRPNPQMFVVAARNELIRGLTRRSSAQGLGLAVIDIAELAQRNLLSATSQAEGLGHRASAALMRHGNQCLLTICAGGELYYARRLEWDEAGLADVTVAPPSALPVDFEGLDFVDYGATATASEDAGAPRLVIELQRSFDVWERSWPSLPLAGLWVETGDTTSLLVTRLEQALDLPVNAFDTERLFPGFDDAAPTPPLRAALLPLLGGLRRGDARQL